MAIYGHKFDSYIGSNSLNFDIMIETLTNEYNNSVLMEADIIQFPGNKSDSEDNNSSGKKSNRFIEFLKRIKQWFIDACKFIKEKISSFIQSIINKVQGGVIAKIINKAMKDINDNIQEDFDIDFDDLDDEMLSVDDEEETKQEAAVQESITGVVTAVALKKALTPVIKAGLSKYAGIDLESIFTCNANLPLLIKILKEDVGLLGDLVKQVVDGDFSDERTNQINDKLISYLKRWYEELDLKFMGQHPDLFKNINNNEDMEKALDKIAEYYNSKNFEDALYLDIANRNGTAKALKWVTFGDDSSNKAKTEIVISIKNVSCKQFCESLNLNVQKGNKTLQKLDSATNSLIQLGTEISSKIDINQLEKAMDNAGKLIMSEKGKKMLITSYNCLVKMVKIMEKDVMNKSQTTAKSIRDQTMLLQKIGNAALVAVQKSA